MDQGPLILLRGAPAQVGSARSGPGLEGVAPGVPVGPPEGGFWPPLDPPGAPPGPGGPGGQIIPPG